MVILTDTWWHWLTLGDSDWHLVTLTDTWWLCLTLGDYDWHLVTLTDTWWLWLTHGDYDWHLVTLTDPDWLRLTPTDPDWHRLTQTDTDWYRLTPTDNATHTAVYEYCFWLKTYKTWLWTFLDNIMNVSYRLFYTLNKPDLNPQFRYHKLVDSVSGRCFYFSWSGIPVVGKEIHEELSFLLNHLNWLRRMLGPNCALYRLPIVNLVRPMLLSVIMHYIYVTKYLPSRLILPKVANCRFVNVVWAFKSLKYIYVMIILQTQPKPMILLLYFIYER
jgi:hypothetical protein